MRKFIYKNKEYRSLAEFCKLNSVSYQMLRRLVRHYRRAKLDPAVACAWIVGDAQLSDSEPKTWAYYRDSQKGQERQTRFRENIKNKILRSIF